MKKTSVALALVPAALLACVAAQAQNVHAILLGSSIPSATGGGHPAR